MTKISRNTDNSVLPHARQSLSMSALVARTLFLIALATANAIAIAFPSGVFASNVRADSPDTGPAPTLPPPHKQSIPKIKVAEAKGWNETDKPAVAAGFSINAFAKDLDHPRWLYVLPNGDVLVAETNAPERKDDAKRLRGWFMKRFMAKAGSTTPSANRITLLRDADDDGTAEKRSVFAGNLRSPFGMALVGEDFYVANTDSVVKYHYSASTGLDAAGETVVELPAGTINHHWTKNLIASRDGKYLYVTVGSNSNVAENGMDNEQQRACILKVDIHTRAVTTFATGLRNPNGLAWHPTSGELWTAVNERDELGDMLVPDYLTSVRDGGFYGWPYSYYGTHIDDRVAPQNADLVARAIPPDYAIGAHTASLGLAFYAPPSNAKYIFPEHYRNGAFVGQHGSWNRSDFAGYKVVFVPFDEAGKPTGPIEEFVTGFLNVRQEAMGRPVGVAIDKSGALLVADDVGNRVWRVVPMAKP